MLVYKMETNLASRMDGNLDRVSVTNLGLLMDLRLGELMVSMSGITMDDQKDQT